MCFEIDTAFSQSHPSHIGLHALLKQHTTPTSVPFHSLFSFQNPPPSETHMLSVKVFFSQ